MTEIALLVDLHRHNERQGPGSTEDTQRALELVGMPDHKKIHLADIGCGTGGQTITLARHINGHITAVDLFPEFLDELNQKSERLGLTDKIETCASSMDALPFGKEAFDIIWSEGAVYTMGFENGIRTWRNFLKKGGYLAVSELTWISTIRPVEIEDYWRKEYPEIDTAANKITILENNGYTLAAYFILSESSWSETYYKPLEAQFEAFLERHKHSELARKVVNDHKNEMELYSRFKDMFSYGFYIARKSG